MKHSHIGSAASMVAACLLFFHSLSGCSGAHELLAAGFISDAGGALAGETAAPQLPAGRQGEVAIRETERELTPQAMETYAYLVFVQAILDEDESALLLAAPLMLEARVPASLWIDGGVWIMSRKSNNFIPFLEEALKAYPDDLSLNLLYADALGEHEMAARGVGIIRRYLEKHPDTIDARLELALLLVKDRQYDEAQAILSAIPPNEHNYLVDYYRARALGGMGKTAEAIPYLRKAVKAKPDFVDALAELAFAHEQTGNLKEARSTYEKLQKLQFSPQDVALRLIDLSIRLKQPEKALQYLRQGPDSLPFKLTAANMLAQGKHYLQAENLLKQIAARKDAPLEVYLLLADIVYEQRRNLKMALSWLDKAPRNRPGEEKVAMLRIQLTAEAGRTAQALAEAEKAAQAYPDAPEVRDMQIRLLAREKKIPEALDKAREAVRKWPANSSLAFLLGSLLDEAGEKAEAMQVMENIIKMQPDNFQALNYIGYTLADENRDLERALDLLNKANELSPDQSYIVDSLAWALHRAGKGEDALREIRRAVSLGDNPDPAIWEHYGDIARDQGQKEEARKAYSRAMELKPANVESIRNKLSSL